MGFLATDIIPVNSSPVSTISPVPKDVYVKAFSVARTDTTASLKAYLPADASIVDISLSGAASDAGTTATVSIGSTTTSNEYVNAQDVKTAGGRIRPTSTLSSSLPNTQPVPLSGDLPIYAKYAESGTVSTAGGPWVVLVTFVR